MKAPSTDEELEDGLLIGLVKSADLTLEALQAKLAQPGSKEHVTRKDRHGRVPMHYACENAAACREPRTLGSSFSILLSPKGPPWDDIFNTNERPLGPSTGRAHARARALARGGRRCPLRGQLCRQRALANPALAFALASRVASVFCL